MPITRYKTLTFQSLRVAIDRKDAHLGFYALKNLIRYGFRSGERRSKAYIDAVLTFPLGGECRKNFFLQRLLHDGKTVQRDVNSPGGFHRAPRQTTAKRQQSQYVKAVN